MKDETLIFSHENHVACKTKASVLHNVDKVGFFVTYSMNTSFSNQIFCFFESLLCVLVGKLSDKLMKKTYITYL